jgi:hypothetical protein
MQNEPVTDKGMLDVLKLLAEAVSTQSTVSNRTWLGLLTVAAVGIFPAKNQQFPTQIMLPFGLASVEPESFYPIMFLMLAVLIIAFCAAVAQQVHAQEEMQSFIERHPGCRPYNIAARKWFDILRLPSLNRVSSVPQYIRGEKPLTQVRGAGKLAVVVFRALPSIAIYFPLKIMFTLIYYGVPVVAIWNVYKNVPPSPSFPCLSYLFLFIGGLVGISLIAVFWMDLQIAVTKVIPHIFLGESEQLPVRPDYEGRQNTADDEN